METALILLTITRARVNQVLLGETVASVMLLKTELVYVLSVTIVLYV